MNKRNIYEIIELLNNRPHKIYAMNAKNILSQEYGINWKRCFCTKSDIAVFVEYLNELKNNGEI